MTPLAKLLLLGDLVKERRQAAGLTTAQLAEQAVLAVEWLIDLETGGLIAKLLRLFAHPAMRGMLEELRQSLAAKPGSNGTGSGNGRTS